MYSLKIFTIVSFFLISCASFMQKDKKEEFSFEAPNIRVEKFPGTFNLKGKGVVKTQCPANTCSPEQISKMDIGAIRDLLRMELGRNIWR